ncbi:rab-protein geranylgeranyltransferase [Flagelloscypha sp. PMI_526]|nr:rab-protein geranylgeranyltransferase [Flagelloscypha sp. PMI_526]
MHGVKRVRYSAEALEARRIQEEQKLKEYLALQKDVLTRKSQKDYSPEAFKLTTTLLSSNPEFYTVWNYRRLILLHGFFSNLPAKEKKDMLDDDLDLTLAVLKKYPKVYWIWNHRSWCLENIPDEDDWLKRSWDRELGFVEKMLDADPRNFHAWSYRRLVLKSHPTPPPDINEIKYTTRKISANFSNFSAWHQRSKVLPKLWESGELDETQSREEDFELLRNAMWTDPNDQSVWMYHRWLMGSNPSVDLLTREINCIKELLEEEPSCKWCLESLFHYKKHLLRHNADAQLKKECLELLEQLKNIDPLRRHRYEDLSVDLQSS